MDEHERRCGPGSGAGDQPHPQVERELGNGAEPEADADADDERGDDEQVPVQSWKRTEHLDPRGGPARRPVTPW